jgi:hypothetical protein
MDLTSCIEYCSITGSDGFYFDSRFGTKIADDCLHKSYKYGVKFKASRVKEIQEIIRVDDTFYISILLPNDIIETLEVKYFDIDQSFIVRTYDPTQIIPAILNNKECAIYLREKNHPFFNPTDIQYDKIYDEKQQNAQEWYRNILQQIHNTKCRIAVKKIRPLMMHSQLDVTYDKKPDVTYDKNDIKDDDDNKYENIQEYDTNSECDSCCSNVYDDVTDVSDVSDVTDVNDVTDVTDVTDITYVTDVTDVTDVSDVNDVNDVNDVSDVNDINDINNINDINKLSVKSNILSILFDYSIVEYKPIEFSDIVIPTLESRPDNIYII